MQIAFNILVLIGVAQTVIVILALGLALGRVTQQKQWKLPDLFWFNFLERFFVKLFGGSM